MRISIATMQRTRRTMRLHNVSVHRFANADGASEALTALSDIVVSAQGLQDVETPAIGDQARGLAGPGDGVNLYVLYVQDGNICCGWAVLRPPAIRPRPSMPSRNRFWPARTPRPEVRSLSSGT